MWRRWCATCRNWARTPIPSRPASQAKRTMKKRAHRPCDLRVTPRWRGPPVTSVRAPSSGREQRRLKMERFTQLYFEIDQTNRTNEKVEALARYFREAPPADA